MCNYRQRPFISSTDSKVRVTLQNSIKYSGSERVNVILICIGNSMTCSDIWHKYHE